MPINTKQATRRELRFEKIDDILADARAVTAGPHHATGNHSPAEIIHHVAYFIDKPVTGFGFTAPLVMRLFGRALRLMGRATAPIAPGLNPPRAVAQRFWPEPGVTLDDAMAYLARSVDAAREPGRMRHPSPLFGRLSHEQWIALNCRHAELHLSFIHPDQAG